MLATLALLAAIAIPHEPCTATRHADFTHAIGWEFPVMVPGPKGPQPAVLPASMRNLAFGLCPGCQISFQNYVSAFWTVVERDTIANIPGQCWENPIPWGTGCIPLVQCEFRELMTIAPINPSDRLCYNYRPDADPDLIDEIGSGWYCGSAGGTISAALGVEGCGNSDGVWIATVDANGDVVDNVYYQVHCSLCVQPPQ